MKFYVYWKSTQDKSDSNKAKDDTVTELSKELLQDVLSDIAEACQREITKDTRIFAVIK
jgi:hypothetical protein